MDQNFDNTNTGGHINNKPVGLKEKASELKDTVMDKASDFKDTATEMKDGASEKISVLKDSASEKMSELKDKAHEVASDLHERTDRSLHSLGERLTEVAMTAREKGMPNVADRLESGGQYLAENGVSEISEQVTGLIRKHPVEAMVIGLGIGVLLGSLLTNRRTNS